MTEHVFDDPSVFVEGATDHFMGRPHDANPYNPTSAYDAFAAWSYGWTEAKELLEMRAQEETRRWLTK